MDGTYAVLFLLAGLTDMGLNHCPAQGCLARRDAEPRQAFSAGEVLFQDDRIGREVYLRYELGHRRGPFRPAVGVSLTDTGDAWVGVGATWSAPFWDDNAYVELSLMPGLYARGDGPDLGHVLEFRSSAEIGFVTRAGWRVGISYDHRSNADIVSTTPGLETLQLRDSVPLR